MQKSPALFDPRLSGKKEWLFMGRIGLPELFIILFIVILIFGATRLPEIGRGLGKGIRNFKDATTRDNNDKTD
jgi:sec-independent protein translocase protein TatA